MSIKDQKTNNLSAAGIVCEYNPFHNGHKYQIEKIRELTGCDTVVGIMSGNFVQRGEAAFFHKKTRAEAAILNGMDLVLELPVIHTLQSAEIYARNSVYTLGALGNIDALCFGAETDDLNLLQRIADLLIDETDEFRRELRLRLDKGDSYSSARGRALETILGAEAGTVVSKPNNILGIEYIKAIRSLRLDIKPIPLLRKNAEHDGDGIKNGFASASAIRKALANNDPAAFEAVPDNLHALYGYSDRGDYRKLYTAIHANRIMMDKATLRTVSDVNEGLENRIKKCAFETGTLPQLIDCVKNKRYTHSRIRRAILASYLGITKTDSKTLPQYIKVLAFNENGRSFLNKCRKTAALPIVKNGKQIEKNTLAAEIWNRELVIERIYKFCLG